MAMTLAEAFVRMRGDTDRLTKDIDSATGKAVGKAGERSGRSFAVGMAKTIGGALVAAGVGRQLVQAVGGARDLAETQSKVRVLFGASAKEIEKFGSTAAVALGQSKQVALDGAATFAVYGRGAGLAGQALAGFSTGMVKLSADMASFSNTSPEEAIQAIGAALRGERDPIEKYGVLLNDANIKARAVSLGLVSAAGSVHKVKAAQVGAIEAQAKYTAAVRDHGKGSLEAQKAGAALGLAQERLKKATSGTIPDLNNQQKILATQAEIYAQTSAAQGDFSRTSGGLANQQKILKAQFENIRTTIGAALLPVVLSFVTALNTQLIPVINELWAKHGPGLTKFFADVGKNFGQWLGQLKSVNWAQLINDGREAIEKLGPAAKDAQASMPDLVSTAKVGGTVIKFLADNADLLAKALPWLAAGFLAVKVAQAASNAVAVFSVPLRVAELAVNRKLVASQAQLTAAVGAQTAVSKGAAAATGAATAATVAGDVATKRSVVSTVAHRAASLASAAATKVWAAGQWLLNVALTANPIGLIIAGIVALIAVIVLAYRNNETFRNIVQKAWKAVQVAIKAVGDWFVNVLWPSLQRAYQQAAAIVTWWWRNIVTPAWRGVQAVIGIAWRGIQVWFAGFRQWIQILATVVTWWWRNIVTPAWNGVRAVIGAGVAVIGGYFSRLMAGVRAVGSAFASGVEIARTAWARLREAARAPVAFVINTVLGGLARNFNTIASKIPGLKIRLPIPAFAGGGRIFGTAMPGGDDTIIAAKRGEYVMPVEQTRKHYGVLEAMRNKVSGFVQGGPVGGPLDWAGGLIGAFRDPVKWLKDRVGLGGLDRFGTGGIMNLIRTAPKLLIDAAIKLIKDKFAALTSLGGGRASLGSGSTPSISALVNVARMFFPGAILTSGYRPGDPGFHGKGLAADFIGGGANGMRRIAQGFYRISGRLLQLIHTPGSFFVANGRRVAAAYYRSALAGHYDHVHVAARANALQGLFRGGLVGALARDTGAPSYLSGRSADRGTYLMPGWNPPLWNGTGGVEHLVPAGGGLTIMPGAFVFNGVDASVVTMMTGALEDFASMLLSEIRKGGRR